MIDFTNSKYEELCRTIADMDWNVITVQKYLQKNLETPCLILRHDVDRFPRSALRLAKIENRYGLQSTYYFRYTRHVFKKEIINEIYDLGHEIGYHYEVLSKARGDIELAAKLFRDELVEFRKLVPVQTASMHGRPLSKYHNLKLWEHYTPEQFGLIGEAYKNIDFSILHYYSDTGRTWHSTKYNLRDKVNHPKNQKEVETTEDLINILKSGAQNSYCLLTHPNRWSSGDFEWGISLLFDLMANLAKIALNLIRK